MTPNPSFGIFLCLVPKQGPAAEGGEISRIYGA